jgi:phosphatidylinositol alpha-1,6-mannosyltransferase
VSPPRQRVLVVSPDYPPAKGGIQILTHRVVENFTEIDPTVVTLGSAGFAEFDRALPFTIHRVPVSPLPRALDVMRLNAVAARIGVRMRPDVILCAHIIASPAAAAVARMTGAPYLQYLHAKEVGARPALARFAVRRADAIVAVSRYTRGLALHAGADPAKIRLVHPGVDVPDEELAVERDRATILTISRLEDRYKGHDVMLRALPLIRAKVPDVQWVVVGDGILRAGLEHLADAIGVRDAVRFLGAVSDGERDAWLRRANVFVMVSRLPAGGYAGEGFGIVYLEANVRGVPTVAANVGGAVDAVVDGRTGLLVDPTDHLAVADAITGLLRDPEQARRLGRQGAERAHDFSWPKISAQIQDLLVELAA